MPDSYIFTSESVTEGHPDKICDQISDAILDAILTSDSQGRVAVECAVTTGLLVILGEITTKTYVDMQAVARRVIGEIGYSDQSDGGFDSNSCGVLTAINKQSPEIAAGVGAALETRSNKSDDKADLTGAGDQGMMFGFACNETPELMPLPISAAHRMARRLSEVRKTGTLPYLKPDGKTQVSVEYKNGVPARIHSIIISTQHAAEIDGEKGKEEILKRITSDLKAYVVMPVFQDLPVKPDSETRYFINPSGSFVVGGPQGDAGLTGRKIIVDTYGGYARHGGGAFSGKDPTKVDRSGAYMARYVAKNVVAAGLATACEVQIAYAIGVARPVSVYVTTFGTGKLPDAKIAELINKHFDMRPAAIIDHFDLKSLPSKNNGCFYQKVAAYGHFGRPDLNLPWEALDKVKELSAALKEAAHV